ncbi:hypothetical protein D5086_001790 [Populus alba]|uniref:Uncharacterized protein n=1 Tax=Populus alba TaxID=43335 RepID=A0ACC4D199_POPAL
MANKNSHKKTKPKSHKSHLKPQALINDFVLASKAPSPSRNVSPISNSPLDGSSVEHKNPSLDGSLEANCAKVKALSLVEHLINPLDGSLDGDCSEDGEFEEEQLDFSCSEEEYATSPPPPSSPALVISKPLSSPAPVVLEPPVPKSFTSSPSRSVKPAATCSIGKACAALKSHVNDRGNDLNHVVAPSVEVPPIAPPSADGPELVAPADAWQIVQKRRQSSRNKQQTHSFLPAECNPPAQQKVSKGKTPVPSVDIAGIKAPHCPGVGVLTRSSVQKNSNPFSGSGGVPPTIPHP